MGCPSKRAAAIDNELAGDSAWIAVESKRSTRCSTGSRLTERWSAGLVGRRPLDLKGADYNSSDQSVNAGWSDRPSLIRRPNHLLRCNDCPGFQMQGNSQILRSLSLTLTIQQRLKESQSASSSSSIRKSHVGLAELNGVTAGFATHGHRLPGRPKPWSFRPVRRQSRRTDGCAPAAS